jgi:penicillin-binding protein 2
MARTARTGASRRRRKQKKSQPSVDLPRRFTWMRWGLAAAMALLILRLAWLQIVMGHIHADRAVSNYLLPIELKSQRGPVYAGEDKKVVVSNRAACDLVLVPKECAGHEEEVASHLEDLIGINGEALLEEIEANRGQPFKQITVKRDVSRRDLNRVEEMSFQLHGAVMPVVRPQRRYPYGETGGQILGWINEIGKAELDRLPGYTRGDVLGRAGIEMAYEAHLKGRNGRMDVERYNQGIPQLQTDPFGNFRMMRGPGGRAFAMDQQGREVTLLYHQPPVAGRPLHITLDMDLQRKCEEILARDGVRGAIVVINAGTPENDYAEAGEVLAMASVPGYDPNVFVSREGSKRRQELLSNEDGLKRMRHRAFQEVYPPGSLYKIMMAAAALEEGFINEHTTFNCPGRFNLGRAVWYCHKTSGHGGVDVVDALTVSCNVFFYNLGYRMARERGIEAIEDWSHRMGVARETGIDLPAEASGLILPPDPSQIYKGTPVNVSIGQGSVAITPLQAAVMTAAVVNGGYLVRPYLNEDIGPELEGPIFSENTLRVLREGMLQCVEKDTYPRGTGRRAAIEGMSIIGKTGTAQVASMDHYSHLPEEEIPYKLRSHAWFVAGVLDQDPPIAMCVLYEHGLHGSSGASPYAKEVMEYFYGRGKHAPVHVAHQEEE